MKPGTVLAERFEIERRVSAGGTSAVFRARDRRLGGPVAVKILYRHDEGEHRERMIREARVLEELRHPGIVRYVAHGETPSRKPYLVMEWVSGETLAKRLARSELSIGESVTLIRRVAEALAVAHARGILHRDIKPANLILRGKSVSDPTLIDFGIARIGPSATAITNTGVMLGTLGFMAPEQAREAKRTDARADVFALGAVLFKCLTGTSAFAGDDEVAILAKMLFEEPPRVRSLRGDVSPALDALVARMLSRDPRARPADAGVAAAELEALDEAALPTREVSAQGVILGGGAPLDELEPEARAITFYHRAAAEAFEDGDLEACLAHAERAVACGAAGEVRGRLLLRMAEAHRWRGDNPMAKDCAEQALTLLPPAGDRWLSAAGEVVEAYACVGAVAKIHLAVEALRDVDATQLSAPHLVALTRAACVLMAVGDYIASDELLRLIDAAYERVRHEPLMTAHVYRTRAYRALVSGDTGSALSMYNVAIARFEAAGDARAACRHLVRAAGACIELGAYGDAQRALNDVLLSAQDMGLTSIAPHVWYHQGMLLARLGDPRSALERADVAVDGFIAQGDRRMEVAARLYRASFAFAAGERERAELEMDVALDDRSATPPLRAFGLAVLAGAHLGRGRAELAGAAARESMSLLEALGGVEEGEALVRLTYAETLDALGDRTGARDAIATARVRILERTAMIKDASWKDTFVQNVHENARTLELARVWGIA